MLKEILQERQLSVYKLSKDTKLPYTTVNEIVLGKKDPNDCSVKTIYTIAKYLNVPIEDIINKRNKKLINKWSDNKKSSFKFNKIIESDLFDVSRIHPLKQRQAVEISKIAKNDNRIAELIIFGSATNITCTIHSDIDIGIKLKDEYINNETKNDIAEAISKITNYNADIIWLDHIEENTNIFNNIIKGVRINV